MIIIKSDHRLPIENFDIAVGAGIENGSIQTHGPLLPSSIRSLIIGPSNCGKTNVMISLIIHPDGLRFENVYVYSKSLFQPKYEYLRSVLEPIKEIGYYTYSNSNDPILDPSEAKQNSIFIFDDVICEQQDPIRAYFCMGRHKNISSFYLAQTYSRVPKQLIRDNANFIILFKQDVTNLRHVYNDHVSPDITFEEFLEMCSKCWNEKHGFLVIDKDADIDKGRYRKGFDNYIKP